MWNANDANAFPQGRLPPNPTTAIRLFLNIIRTLKQTKPGNNMHAGPLFGDRPGGQLTGYRWEGKKSKNRTNHRSPPRANNIDRHEVTRFGFQSLAVWRDAAVLLYICSGGGLSWNALYDGIPSSAVVGEAEAAGRSWSSRQAAQTPTAAGYF